MFADNAQQSAHFDIRISQTLFAKLKQENLSLEYILYVIFGRTLSTYFSSNAFDLIVYREGLYIQLNFSYDEITLIEQVSLNFETELQKRERIEYIGLAQAFKVCPFAIEFTSNNTINSEDNKIKICRINYQDKMVYGVEVLEIFKRFKIALTNIGSTQKVQELSLLKKDEKNEILDQLKKPVTYPTQTLHQLIEEQVEKTPEQTAIVYDEESMTYAVLNQRANQLAHYLKNQLNIKPGAVIAVCMPPSFDMVTAAIAIWKVGGVLLFVDTKAPKLFLQEQLEECKAAAFLTNSTAFEKLKSHVPSEAETVSIDRVRQEISKENEINLTVATDSRASATIFYTSGSTGKPNAVLNGHAQFVNHIIDMRKRFHVNEQSRILLLTNCSFDPIIADIVLPLCCGALCNIVNRTTAENPGQLKNYINSYGITLLQLTPVTLAFLYSAHWQPSAEIQVLCGGAALSKELAGKYPKVKLRYGTTESTGYSSEEQAQSSARYDSRNIGRSINGTSMFILDHNGQLSPYGRIHVGGVCISLGYLNNPEETKHCFPPNPFSLIDDRMYRTGDYAICLPDGTFLCCGRESSLLKINEHRIHEQQIVIRIFSYTQNKEKSIDQCVVLYHPISKTLEAFYTLKNPDDHFDKEELYGYLKLYLAHVTIPFLRQLKNMPVLLNGKIDYGRLREMSKRHSRRDSEIVTGDQQDLFGNVKLLWSHVLDIKIDQIHSGSHFFSNLRGNSLKAVQLINILRDKCPSLEYSDVYNHPTLGDFVIRMESLIADPGFSESTLPLLEATVIDDDSEKTYPLSIPQADLAFAYQFSPAAYNSLMVVRFEKVVNVEALINAFHKLIEIHEILRTQLLKNGDRDFRQKVYPPLNLEEVVKRLNVRQVESLDETRVKKIASDELHQSFDLEKDFPLRIQLLKNNLEQAYLLVCVPHTHIDGQSEQLFLKQLLSIYDAYKNNRPIPSLSSSIQFRDFARWQQKVFADPDNLKTQRKKVERHLKDLPSSTIYSESDIKDRFLNDGKQLFFHLSKEIKDACVQFTEKHGGTLFTVICTAYFVLLHRYMNQDELAIGVATSGRYLPELETCMGQFATLQTLALHEQDLDSDVTSFLSVYSIVQRHVQAMLDVQSIPFSEQMKLLRKHKREMPGVMLAYLEEETDFSSFSDVITVDPFMVEVRQAKYPITLYVSVRANGKIECALEFKTAMYEESFMQQFADHFQKTLSYMTERPSHAEKFLNTFPLLSKEEVMTLQKFGTGKDVVIPEKYSNLAKLFKQSCQKYLNNTALWFEFETMTYQALGEKSDHLAKYLITHGITVMPIGQEKVVAVCLEKSFELYIAFWAIIKSGGCFLAIPPYLPSERIKAILEDSAAALIITQGEHKDFIKKELQIETPLVLMEDPNNVERDAELSIHNIKKKNAAYMIYTSGSTGKPKATISTQGGAVNTCMVQGSKFGITTFDRCGGWALPTFDVFILDLLGAIKVGASVCIPPPGVVLTGERLLNFLTKDKITFLNIPPSVLRPIDSIFLPSLKTVVFGGEPCTFEEVKRWRANRNVYIAFGLSEAHGVQTIYKCSLESRGRPPIGNPIQNLIVVVLDDQYHLVPRSVPGELYLISNVCLARGYIQDEQNRKVFVEIPHPFDATKKVRALRTFDVVYWNDQGELIYVRRRGTEIKISGIRIDTEGVKKLILNTGLAKTAVTVLWINPNDAKDVRLFAVVVLKEDMNLSATDGVIQKIGEILIQHLQPAVRPKMIIPLAEIPLTRHGKIDNRALLKIIEERVVKKETTKNPPETAVEIALAQMWSKILNIEMQYIGLGDNFFALGASSQHVVELKHQIINKWESLERKLTDPVIFQNNSLEKLSDFIQKNIKVVQSFLVLSRGKKKEGPRKKTRSAFKFL